jgi:D-alanyl-D-alanine carboxypeptidase/D-alanyl-D-alanine carboxypeptidase (penicillin-binding protein 5/6)
MYETSDFFTRPIGIKSGFTSEAGFNLVSSAVNKDGMELIAVVLGGGEMTQYKVVADSKMIIEHGYQEYSIQKLTEAGINIKNVAVANAKEDPNIILLTKSELSCVLPNNIDDRKVTSVENIDKNIQAPIQKGDILGSVEYIRNGISLGKVDLVSDRSVARKTSAATILLNVLKIILIVIACFFAMRLTLRYVSRRINAKKRASS